MTRAFVPCKKDGFEMKNVTNPIGWLRIQSSPFEIGAEMGRLGRAAVHEHLLQSAIWSQITSDDHSASVTRMLENTQNRFPDIYEELRGLAAGLDLSLQDVAAWNCRGDILTSVPDGCTTIQTPGPRIEIAHNEDGLPFFRGHCFILDAQPAQSTGFRAFCYPGSLAGHTMGWNDAGLVQATNNLRLKNVEAGIPRMVLGRAVLAEPTLQGAVGVLANDPQSGGFHMTLAQSGQPMLLSVEYGGGGCSVVEIKTRSAHANHALHLAQNGQRVTRSSQDRQITADRMVGEMDKTALEILRDTSGPGLPIRRDDPRDPDEENTLATCIFDVLDTGVTWKVYSEKGGQPAYQGALEPT